MHLVYSKKIYFYLIKYLYQGEYLKQIEDSQKLVILNLHRVSNDINPFYPSLTPKLFEELLIFITEEFNVITFREIEIYKNSKKPNLILSFDDGFYDFLEYAMPLLDKYKIRANLNIIPQCIKTGKPVWDIMLGDFLNKTPLALVNSIILPNFKMKLTKVNQGEFGLSLTRYLKEKTKEERELLWLKIEKIMSKGYIKFTKMLTKEEVLEISKIHEIGVHSYSHESMAIESQDFFEKDFWKCKEYFLKTLGLPLDIYAFPSGSYTEYQLDFLYHQEVRHILLVNEKYSNINEKNHNRFTFYGNSISEIKLRALGYTR